MESLTIKHRPLPLLPCPHLGCGRRARRPARFLPPGVISAAPSLADLRPADCISCADPAPFMVRQRGALAVRVEIVE